MEVAGSQEIIFSLDDPKSPVGTDRFGNFWLTDEEARTLEGEVVELFSRYIQLGYDDPETLRKEHVFIYAFVPLESS